METEPDEANVVAILTVYLFTFKSHTGLYLHCLILIFLFGNEF